MPKPKKQTPYHFVVKGGYDKAIFQQLLSQNILKKPVAELRDLIIQSKHKPITTQEVDKISIVYQILSKVEGGFDGVKRADHLVDSAHVVFESGPKTDERYHRCVNILKHAISGYTPSWYHKHALYLLQLSTMPSYFGYSQELACQKTAELAFNDMTHLNPDDFVIATRDWIASLIRVNVQIPPPAINLTYKFFEVLDKKFLAPQYKGEFCFLKGFMLHYYGNRDFETFQKAVKHYTESLSTGDQKYGPSAAIESGKYAAIFHFAKLLKYPEVFGFDKKWADTDGAEKLDSLKKELLQNGSASYRYELHRLLGSEGLRTQTASWLGFMMGQSDNLDENYSKAMQLIDHITLTTSNQTPKNIAQHKIRKAWLFLNKPHLFQNPYENVVTEITESLCHYLTSLDGNTSYFEWCYIEMAFKVIRHPMCQALPQVWNLREIVEVVREKFGGCLVVVDWAAIEEEEGGMAGVEAMVQED